MENEDLYTLKPLDCVSKQTQLFLNKKQLELLQLKAGRELNLQVGFDSLTVQVAEQHKDPSLATLYLSDTAFRGLSHYHGEALWLVFHSHTQMRLGPTFAITVSYRLWNHPDKNYALKKRAQLALKKGILLYCFHLRKVDLENNLVEACYLNPQAQKWTREFLPFPQVLYHRSYFPFAYFSRQGNTNNIYHKVWANPKIQKINNAYRFDKWTVYQALARFQHTNSFHPESALFSSQALALFLTKYPFCYVKHIRSIGGKKVCRLERAGAFYTCKMGGSIIKRWKFSKISRLFRFLRKKFGKRLIIQGGITLARLNGKPFDIRVLVQKDVNARWVISALSFRVAAPEAVVTNVAAGAQKITLAPDDDLLGCGIALDSLQHMAFKTLDALEAFYGSLGEVGLDMALDNDGKLWLLEANLQPSSSGYQKTATLGLCNQIFGLPLDYAKYLARNMFSGFPQNQHGVVNGNEPGKTGAF